MFKDPLLSYLLVSVPSILTLRYHRNHILPFFRKWMKRTMRWHWFWSDEVPISKIDDPSPTSPNKTTSPKLAQLPIYGNPITPFITSREPIFPAPKNSSKKLVKKACHRQCCQSFCVKSILKTIRVEASIGFFSCPQETPWELNRPFRPFRRGIRPGIGDLLTMVINHWN